MTVFSMGLLAHLSLLKEINESSVRDSIPVRFSYILKATVKFCCQRSRNHHDTSALTPGKWYRLMHHSLQEFFFWFFFLHLPEGSHDRILVEFSDHMTTSKKKKTKL